MPIGRNLWWALGLCALLGLLAAFWWYRGVADEVGQQQRNITVMSSIALQWGEGDLGSIARSESAPDPVVARLAELGQLTFVDNIAQLQAAGPDVAILIQPRALSPDELVRLDNWVRAGGRLLLFADPALQWPSSLPLGDPQRPLFTSMLSPILAHWGLDLALPMDATEATVEASFRDFRLAFVAPGIWQAGGGKDANGQCRIDRAAFVAECRPGKGQVLLVADADLLHSEQWQAVVGRSDDVDNLRFAAFLIDALSAGRRVVGSAGK
jgi:hypothetical protein